MSAASMHDDLAAYALGALDGPDRLAVERAVSASPALARELRDLTELSALLALAAPPRTPPAALRDRVLEEARGVRPIRSAPSPASGSRSSDTRRPLRTVLPWLLAAASFAGAVVTARGTASERDARAVAEGEATTLRAQLASLDSLVATLTASELSTVTLASTGAPPSARLYWNRARGEVVLAAFRLPPAATGRTYQLWGIATGQAPVSLGTFKSAGEGREVARFRMPPGLQLAVGAVTEEPEGGSPQPSSTPFLAGTLRATE